MVLFLKLILGKSGKKLQNRKTVGYREKGINRFYKNAQYLHRKNDFDFWEIFLCEKWEHPIKICLKFMGMMNNFYQGWVLR